VLDDFFTYVRRVDIQDEVHYKLGWRDVLGACILRLGNRDRIEKGMKVGCIILSGRWLAFKSLDSIVYSHTKWGQLSITGVFLSFNATLPNL
jgi:formylmethanofuran dehydrogenase subunit C